MGPWERLRCRRARPAQRQGRDVTASTPTTASALAPFWGPYVLYLELSSSRYECPWPWATPRCRRRVSRPAMTGHQLPADDAADDCRRLRRARRHTRMEYVPYTAGDDASCATSSPTRFPPMETGRRTRFPSSAMTGRVWARRCARRRRGAVAAARSRPPAARRPRPPPRGRPATATSDGSGGSGGAQPRPAARRLASLAALARLAGGSGTSARSRSGALSASRPRASATLSRDQTARVTMRAASSSACAPTAAWTRPSTRASSRPLRRWRPRPLRRAAAMARVGARF